MVPPFYEGMCVVIGERGIGWVGAGKDWLINYSIINIYRSG
jgi:hypothetical protein